MTIQLKKVHPDINDIKAFLFGLIEGITEWLPISSTGHLLLINQFLNLQCSDDFLNMFPIEEKALIAKNLENGNITYVCR